MAFDMDWILSVIAKKKIVMLFDRSIRRVQPYMASSLPAVLTFLRSLLYLL
jgi:hypothetical protein